MLEQHMKIGRRAWKKRNLRRRQRRRAATAAIMADGSIVHDKHDKIAGSFVEIGEEAAPAQAPKAAPPPAKTPPAPVASAAAPAPAAPAPDAPVQILFGISS